MIDKFAQVNPEERAKRKMECLETIKKACKKSDHDVNIGEHLCLGDLTVEDINFLSHSLRIQLSEIEGRLRLWKNLDKIDNIQQLRKMEDSISKSLSEIVKHKYGMGSLIFGAGQDFQPSSVQHGMEIPSKFDARKELHPCSSFQGCDGETMDACEDRNSFDLSLVCDTGQDFEPSSLMQHWMNVEKELYQCSSVHGGNSENMNVYENLNSFAQRYLEEPSFSVESYTNLVCNKEIEVSKPEFENFVPGEMFLDCQLNQEDIAAEFGFTFDVPQLEQANDQGNAFDCSINKGSGLLQTDFVNVHDNSKSASETCDNVMFADSLNFLHKIMKKDAIAIMYRFGWEKAHTSLPKMEILDDQSHARAMHGHGPSSIINKHQFLGRPRENLVFQAYLEASILYFSHHCLHRSVLSIIFLRVPQSLMPVLNSKYYGIWV